VFILQKLRSIAVLKCLGATSGQIIAVYLLQVMTLGLAGSLLGVGLARLAIAAIPYFLTPTSSSLLAAVQYGVTASAAAQGIGIGVLRTLVFSVGPLLHAPIVRPSLLLRYETKATGRDWVEIIAMVLVTAALVGFTAWQASSLRVGLIVCAGFATLAIVLQLTGRLLVRVVSPLASAPSF